MGRLLLAAAGNEGKRNAKEAKIRNNDLVSGYEEPKNA
jgi:hypothetical protein